MQMKAKVPLDPEVLSKIKADEDFRRLTGVRQETFNKMLKILEAAQIEKKRKGGRPNKLRMEKMLRMALEYWREYRTYFHIGKSYGLSESNVYQTIKWIENVLIKDGIFSLPGKKALLNENAIGFIKRFKIVSERYRNRRKRFGLRFSLIAGFCNYEL